MIDLSQRLIQRHIDDLYKSGLSDEVIWENGLCSASEVSENHIEALNRYFGRQHISKFTGNALLIPYDYEPSFDSKFLRAKPDDPIKAKDGKDTKYLSRSGARNHLYVPVSYSKTFKGPLIITEGEKKALKATQEGFNCVALAGVSSWVEKPRDDKGRKLKGQQSIPIKGLDGITSEGRKIYICFDSDVMTKPTVQVEMMKLASEIKYRKMKPYSIYIPSLGDEDKTGLDDYLEERGPKKFEALVEAAQPIDVPSRDAALLVATNRAVPFPIDVMPRKLRQVIEQGARATSVPLDFIGVPMLAILGSAIGNSHVIKVKDGFVESAAIWASVVGSPGVRKSPALKVASTPIYNRQKKLHEEYEAEKMDYDQIMRRYSKDKNNGSDSVMPREPVEKQVFTTDATMEALSDLLYQNSRGILILRDELSGWALAMNQYKGGGGADRQNFLSIWTGSPTVINRKSRGTPLTLLNPFVGVTGCIPPDILSDLADQRGRDDGFIHRILFSYPDDYGTAPWTDQGISELEIEGYCTIYNDLLALEGGRTPLTFSHSGRRKWIIWYDAHATELSEAPEALQGPYAKMPGYCARFCLIIHLTRLVCREAKDMEIDEISVLSAIALIEYFKNHLRKVYDRFYESDMDRKIKKLIDWMQRHVNRISYRDCYRNGVAGCKHKKDAEPLFNEFVNRGHGELQDNTLTLFT